MTAAPVKALYYPFIEIQSEDWLKCALLYWEGIKRIVPHEGYRVSDSGPIAELVEAGIVENVAAGPYTETIAKEFLDQPRKSHDEVVAEARIHREKLAPSVIAMLLEQGHAIQEGDWLLVNPGTADDYMYILANAISRAENAPTVTDYFSNTVRRAKQEYGINYGVEHEGKPSGMRLAWIACPFPEPSALGHLSLQDVLKFREAHGPERRAFRDAIHRLGSSLSDLTSAKAVRDTLDDQSADIRERIKEQRETLAALNIKTLALSLSLSVPSAITGVLAGSPVIGAIAGAAGLSVAAINIFAARREERKRARSAFPYHYLLSIEEALKPAELQSQYNRSSSQFFIM